MHRNSQVLIKALDHSQFCKRIGKRDCEVRGELGVCLVPFHLRAVLFSKELTASPIVMCGFSTSGPNGCIGYLLNGFSDASMGHSMGQLPCFADHLPACPGGVSEITPPFQQFMGTVRSTGTSL